MLDFVNIMVQEYALCPYFYVGDIVLDMHMPTQNGEEPVGEITFLGLSCLTSVVSRRNS